MGVNHRRPSSYGLFPLIALCGLPLIAAPELHAQLSVEVLAGPSVGELQAWQLTFADGTPSASTGRAVEGRDFPWVSIGARFSYRVSPRWRLDFEFRHQSVSLDVEVDDPELSFPPVVGGMGWISTLGGQAAYSLTPDAGTLRWDARGGVLWAIRRGDAYQSFDSRNGIGLTAGFGARPARFAGGKFRIGFDLGMYRLQPVGEGFDADRETIFPVTLVISYRLLGES